MNADQHEPQSSEMELNDDDAEEIIDLEGSQGIDGIEPLLVHNCSVVVILQLLLIHKPCIKFIL